MYVDISQLICVFKITSQGHSVSYGRIQLLYLLVVWCTTNMSCVCAVLVALLI